MKSCFNTAMTAGTVAGILHFGVNLESFALFFSTTGVSVLFGHSLGMHRKWIHNAYDCPRWMELLFVHFGTLMGISGPVGMMKAHDLRDWAQRQPEGQCHTFFSQHEPWWKDWVRQAHFDIKLDHPPAFVPEPKVTEDKAIQWMEKTWPLQQLPYGALFYALGGWKWVTFGVCARVFASVSGHFVIGWFAHNNIPGHNQQGWLVDGAAVQGYNWTCQNVPMGETVAAVMTAGESYHNNHHAFPGSARLAHKPGEIDIGYHTLQFFERAGLVSGLRLPEDLPARPELIDVHDCDRHAAPHDNTEEVQLNHNGGK